MKYVPDSTSRFRFDQRPHYEPAELDELCERTILDFMNERCGGTCLPVPTDILTKLIERDTQDFDLYADLADIGQGVEGFTDFYPDQKPVVMITEKLSLHKWQESRLRTTLAHEYGHVLLHAPLFNTASPCKPCAGIPFRSLPQRRGIDPSKGNDWMEWQAWYAARGILMPVTLVKREVMAYCQRYGAAHPICICTGHARDLIHKIAKVFAVSEDVAKIRLQRLNWLCS